jgi:hypothetical protein
MTANNQRIDLEYLMPFRAGAGRLCKPLNANRRVGPDMRGRGRPAIDVQLEDAGDHNDRLRAVPILEHCELQSFRTIDKKTAAEPLLILHDPMAVTVLADAE